MRSVVLMLLVAVVLGLTTGVATAMLRFRAWPCQDASLVGKASQAKIEDASIKRPRLDLPETAFNFGSMDAQSIGQHDFVFANQGDASLMLTEGESSCGCTVIMLDESEIRAGQSGTVGLQWNAKGMAGPFHQTASIHTNDPSRELVMLSISGQVVQAVRSHPSEVSFSGMTIGRDTTRTVSLLAYLDSPPLKVEKWEIGPSDLGEHFDVEIEPMTLKEVQDEDELATSGCRLIVMAKSTLPLGAIQQTITLQTNIPEAETMELPIVGSVRSELSIVGPGWNQRLGTLYLGTVDRSRGIRRELFLLAHGSHQETIRVEIEDIVPDLLKVEFGEPVAFPVQGGSVTRLPFTISVPPESRPAHHLGSDQARQGRIDLKTNHPNAPRLRIFVRFAVEG